MSKSLFHVLESGVADRQPQVAHMKWRSQEAAANTSDLIAYICPLNIQRKMMVLVNLETLLCLIIHICIHNR